MISDSNITAACLLCTALLTLALFILRTARNMP